MAVNGTHAAWGHPTSLIPRPSYRPVFDCFQYAEMEGEGLGPFYDMNDASVYLGRQRGERVSDRKNAFMHMFLVLNSSAWGINYKIRSKACSFDGGTFSPSVYQGGHWHHSCDKMDQVFPLQFFILQVIKNRKVGRPENEAITRPHLTWHPLHSHYIGESAYPYITHKRLPEIIVGENPNTPLLLPKVLVSWSNHQVDKYQT